MSRSVSFLRRITFKMPTAPSPLWIRYADLYEDENRIYAFLTFVSQEKNVIERCKIRITPFDEGKYGMDSFGIQILNLGLKPGATIEHPDPLILPKGTYAFNFSLVSYGFKRKKADVEAPASIASSAEPASSGEPVSANEESPSEAAQAEPKKEESTPNEALLKNPNRIRPLGKMPGYLPFVLVALAIIAGFILFMTGIWVG